MTVDDQFAALHETHSGLVVLCGDRAYKVKKPVRTDFLDFTTPQLREAACARELELNRRLSPDVYLGLAHLSGPAGDPSEPVLVMRRMPDAARLSGLLADRTAARAALCALSGTLAAFHDSAVRGTAVDRSATADAVRGRWHSLLHGLTDPPVAPALTARLTDLTMRYLNGRKPLFDKRIATNRIVDGHGDLHAGDIFALPDGFRILDCLDFDDELRHVDRLDDVAFLAMDLEFLGHPDLAETFVEDYLTRTGDPAPSSLRHHYIAYRAVVRAKVNCIRHQQGAPEAAEHATRHLEIAQRHLRAGALRLALVGGLPGTGKSTVAQRLGAATGAVVLSSDRVRAGQRTTGVLTGPSGVYGRGAYDPAAKARTYAVLRAEAYALLAAGRSVILDASWTDSEERRRAAKPAEDTSADLIELHCIAPRSVAAARIAKRTGTDSEATPAIAADMASAQAPWPTASVLDTTRSLDDTADTALAAWNRDQPTESIWNTG